MLSTLAHSSLAAPAPAKFHTIPLVKRPLTIKKLQTMERSVKVGYAANGAPTSIVINDYQDAQCYGPLSIGTPGQQVTRPRACPARVLHVPTAHSTPSAD